MTTEKRSTARRRPTPGSSAPDLRPAVSVKMRRGSGAFGRRSRLRLVGYLRVSSVEQAEHGYGLASQRAAIQAAARRIGAKIVKWCADPAVSGTLPATERPGLTEALELLHVGKANGLIVRDLDRLARAVTVQEAALALVWREDARVFTATGEVLRDDPDDPMRTAMREMAGVFAGLERGMLVKRLRDGRAAKKSAGGHSVGRVPYGWATGADGALAKVPAEQQALRLMREMAADGASTHAIAEALAAQGYPTQRGGSWHSATVARVLARSTPSPAAQSGSTRKAAS